MKNVIGLTLYALVTIFAAFLLFISNGGHNVEDRALDAAMGVIVYLIGRDIRINIKNS